MKTKNYLIIVLLTGFTLASSGCGQREVKRTIYNMGAQSDCIQATENLPNSDQRKQDCLLGQNKDRPSYDDYEKQREELLEREDQPE